MLEVFLFGARRMEFIGQRMLDGLEAAQLYEQVRQTSSGDSKLAQVERLIGKNGDTYQRWGGSSPLSGFPRAGLTPWTGL